MPYVLEKISLEDQEKILNDANCDERKKRFLLMRGGHFENNPGLGWAVDRENDSYLFWAPRPPMVSQYKYFFFYDSRMYSVYINSPSGNIVYFDDKQNFSVSYFEVMKIALKNAFSIHRIYGLNDDTPFAVVFDENI